MLWNPAHLAALGTRPVISSDLPALASPVQAFDASNTALFFTDVGGTAPAANGSLIARANDANGGAWFFRQQVQGERPTLVTNAVNGKPALRFNGTTSWLALQNAATGFANAGELFRSLTFTLLLAFKTASVDGGVFAAGNSTGGEGGNAFDNLTVQLRGDGTVAVARHSGGEYRNAYLSGASHTMGAVSKVVVRSSPQAGIHIRSKSSAGTFDGTTSTPATADIWTWDFAALGAEMGHQWGEMPFNLFTGDIMEMRFWNSRASDAELASLLAYLDAKWGN